MVAPAVAKNNKLILMSGKSGTGKSASLRTLREPEKAIYLNCESNKELPFPSKFKELTVIKPLQVYQAFTEAEKMPDIHTIIVDSLTFLLDISEQAFVQEAADTQKGWGNFQIFFKKLMQHYVAKSTKNIIFTAHVLEVYSENAMIMETKIPVKGALKNNGIEAYFSNNIATKKITLKDLEPYQNDLLTITPEDEMLGYKHVFQTRLTKDTIGERIRSGIDMWSIDETFIDNNAQYLLDRLNTYYGG